MALLLGVEDIGKRIGARELFGGVSFQVHSGDRIALVGPNGAGKSTLLRLLAGDDAADEGRVIRPRRSCIERLRQEIDPARETPVRDEAATALAHLSDLEAELGQLESEMTRAGERGDAVSDEVADRYDQVRAAFEHGGGFAREARVDAVLSGLGFDGEARHRPLSSFSGGWLMRVELAKLLLSEPDVLLLDEPTNHLDLPAIQWFEETLADFPGGVVVVSHDRAFLRKHARRVLELDGRGRFTVYEAGYDRYLAMRAQRLEERLAQQRNQEREIAHMEKFVERFKAKASKAKQAQSRMKALEKIERIEVEPGHGRGSRLRLRIPEPPRSGEMVMTLSDIHKSYGDTEVYHGADLEIRRGERVALVGPNGAGKSTLLRIVAGALDFDSGERRPGHNVQVAFYAQHQLEVLDPDDRVLGALDRVANHADGPRLRGHLGAFLFSGDDVEKKVSVLSGGEKARLALARMLLRPANFLVLDEPTNHLDVDACEVLEGALSEFSGTLAFISHDREFINALATRVIEVRDGELREFIGNYDDYLRRTAANTPDDVAAPEAAGRAAPAPIDDKSSRQRERARRKARERIDRRIARLEEAILEAEKQVEALGWDLGTPEVYRDPERTRELEAQREALRETVAGQYLEWEKLAEELEELGEGPADA